MAHKCFISFKTEDMDYKKKIQEDMDIDMIDKSLDEPINSDDEDYIMRKIREDYLADSTVTIYLIGEYSAENSFLQDQTYIKRELQASLYNGENNTKNGILGIVLPSMYDKVYKGKEQCSVCGKNHKELSAPTGYKVDKTVYPLTIKAGETATLNVSDTPKVTDTLIELFKIDMETQKDNPQGNASLAGAEFTWKYYAGFYNNKDNIPAEATRTWVTKTIAEKDGDGTIHYVTRLADAYKVSGDSFYMQDGKAVLPLGTLTVEETKAPNGYFGNRAWRRTWHLGRH